MLLDNKQFIAIGTKREGIYTEFQFRTGTAELASITTHQRCDDAQRPGAIIRMKPRFPRMDGQGDGRSFIF